MRALIFLGFVTVVSGFVIIIIHADGNKAGGVFGGILVIAGFGLVIGFGVVECNRSSKELADRNRRTTTVTTVVVSAKDSWTKEKGCVQRVYKKDRITVEEHLNGERKLSFRNHYLNYVRLPERPKKQINITLPALTAKKASGWIPPANHPWRTQLLFTKKQPLAMAVK
jgi:hypothetical protein